MNVSDFSSASFYENPYPLYKQLRAEGAMISLLPTLWITGHHRVAEIMLREKHLGKNFMGYVRSRYDEETAAGAAFELFNQSILMMNPPEHTILKALWAKAFNARHRDQFESLAKNTTNDLVDTFYSDGGADLVAQYANQIPIVVICKLLGLDQTETSLFTRELWHLTAALTRSVELANLSAQDLVAANEATLKLREFFREVLYRRRVEPGFDLISLLLTLEEDGLRMSDEQIVANIIFLFAAGHETSGNMIGNALVCLFRQAGLVDRIRANQELLPACVLECLRYDSSVQVAAREVIEDFNFEGFHLRQGDTVVVSLGSANHDPEKFERPDHFLIDRAGLDARDLASFGGGAHYCVGARLALIEIQASLETLFARLPDFQITNLESLNWHQTNTIRGVSSINAKWSV